MALPGFLKVFILTLSMLTMREAKAEAESEPVYIILNMENQDSLPRNFRMCTSSIINSPDPLPSLEGLAELKASASAQFSQQSLKIINEILPPNPIVIVDLRQESHGFADGRAISWYSDKNWHNLGKTLKEILEDEQKRLAKIEEDGFFIVYEKDHIVSSLISAATIESVSEALTEDEIAKLSGVYYIRIPVPDHRKPQNHEVDQFIEFVKSLPDDAWLHFHCAAGRGRSTMFMAMYDMMKNARKVSYHDILARQKLIGGKDLTVAPKTKSYYPYLVERIAFLEHFYEYCKQNPEFAESWSSWSLRQFLSQSH